MKIVKWMGRERVKGRETGRSKVGAGSDAIEIPHDIHFNP